MSCRLWQRRLEWIGRKRWIRGRCSFFSTIRRSSTQTRKWNWTRMQSASLSWSSSCHGIPNDGEWSRWLGTRLPLPWKWKKRCRGWGSRWGSCNRQWGRGWCCWWKKCHPEWLLAEWRSSRWRTDRCVSPPDCSHAHVYRRASFWPQNRRVAQRERNHIH